LKNEDNKIDLITIITDSLNIIEPINQSDDKVLSDSISTIAPDGYTQLSYKFNVDTSGNFLTSIFIYSDLIKVQEIKTNKFIQGKKFSLIDWNFDGYKDITVLDNCGSGGCAYWIWNYSPKKNRYIYNEKLSEVLGLEIDTIGKYVVFHYRAGFPEEFWDTLEYKNNKLSFVKGLFQRRWHDTLGNLWYFNTYSKVINKKLVVTVDTLIIESAN
jgi:hypothetical protein